MFDKDLFLALCEKYDVELSDSVEKPMMKDANGVHEVTDKDVYRVFASCQIYFGYSDNKIDTNVISEPYYCQEDLAIAC